MEKKYCVGLIHDGTDHGIFLAGPDDEKLTFDEAIEPLDIYYNFTYITFDEYFKMGGNAKSLNWG
jgi:hypothetical protein